MQVGGHVYHFGLHLLMPSEPTDTNAQDSAAGEERQCRICLDGVDAEPELGRLIRPCLCRGSISVCPIYMTDRGRWL